MSGRDGVVAVDQTAIRGSRRSNPATYTGLLEPIRKAFAKANGVKPALFSANSEGACPTCNGAGVIYTDLGMMAGVATTCEECEGKRFDASVLEYTFGGRDISEVLAMSVTDAEKFFAAGEAATPAAHKILERLVDVGLGYLSLGQPLTTLSGGERQRLKLATHLGEKGGVYVLDEPTTGLHLADVEQLLGLLDRLVESGKSVIVIEHHQAVMAHADWIIDLGPGAGHDGGRIVFEGTPSDLVAARSTLTGEHLAEYVAPRSTVIRSVEAELVAFGVLHHDVPRLQRRVGLVALQPGGAEPDQALALGLQRGHPFVALQAGRGPHVEVHAVLDDLAFRHLLEEQPRARTVGVLGGGPAVPLGLGYADLAEELVPRVEDVLALGHVTAGRPGVDVAQHGRPETAQALGVGAVVGHLDRPAHGDHLATPARPSPSGICR